MKKKLVIAVMVFVVALIGALAGCQTKFTITDVYDIATYKNGSPERNTVVDIKQGETVIYHANNDKVETSLEGFDFKSIIKAEDGDTLSFDSSYFENENLETGKTEATYTANIKDVEAFLGVKNAKDATIEIIVNPSDKTFKSTRIKYTVEKSIGSFEVAIAVLA